MDVNIAELLDLLVVPGESTKEEEIDAYLVKRLLELGVPKEAIYHDRAAEQSEYGGMVGQTVKLSFHRTVFHDEIPTFDPTQPAKFFQKHLMIDSVCRPQPADTVAPEAGPPDGAGSADIVGPRARHPGRR